MMSAVLLAALHCPEQVNGFDFQCFQSMLFSNVWFGPALLVLVITLVSQTAGVILGLPLALGRISRNRLVKAPVDFYLWIFRGTPLLLQHLFVYDGTAELTNNSPYLYFLNRDAVIAGAITLALNEAAYMTEIIRSGLQAVDPGQGDAAKALGMTRLLTLRRIVVPQALRIVVPPTTNEYINMSKNTSLLFVISVHELLQQAANFYSANYRTFEALAVAAIYYLLITSFLTQIQKRIEDRFGERQDPGRGRQPGFLRRAFVGQRVSGAASP
jgi:polar amino acid transport system permease protein